MEMEYDFDLLMGYLENRDYRSLRAALAEENEVDIADFIERLFKRKGIVVLSKLTGLFLSALASQMVFEGARNLLR